MSSTATAHRLFAASPRSRALLDVTIAAVVLVGSLALLSHGDGAGFTAGSHRLDLTGILLAACSAAPLLAWRRYPFGVFVMSAAACTLLAGLGYPLGLTLGPTVAIYLLAASRGQQNPWTAWTATTVVALFVAYLGARAAVRGEFPGIVTLHTGLAWAGAWFAGERTRLRQEQVAELNQRALRAERDAERERQLAVAEERARIARDLHDSAAHAISVIGVRAGAARLRYHQDPGRSLAALEAIEQLSRQTVAEIDQIVGTLRVGPPSEGVEAPPGLASLDTLISHHTATGLHLAVETSGPPPALGSPADQAIYRILQEALTNAARHGTGGARVALTFTDTAAELTVTNPARADDPSRCGGGHGLIGMQERATLLGGSLEAGRANGTYRVHARIPYPGHRT